MAAAGESRKTSGNQRRLAWPWLKISLAKAGSPAQPVWHQCWLALAGGHQ